MSWTYTGDLTNIRRDRIRFMIGDTDTTDQLLQDGEVDYYLTKFPNDYLCAAALCDAIAAKFSRQVMTNNAGLMVAAAQRSQAYRDRAAELRREASKRATIFVGGISKPGKAELAEDTDAVQPAFSRGLDDYPGADT